jgi:hypothetical protein
MGEFELARGASKCQGLGTVARMHIGNSMKELMHVDDKSRVWRQSEKGTRFVVVAILYFVPFLLLLLLASYIPV